MALPPGFDISDDGQTVIMMFGEPPQGVVLRVPSQAVAGFYAGLGAVLDTLRAAKMVPPGEAVVATMAETVTVRESKLAGLEKFAGVVINEGLTSETFTIMTHLTALRLADALQQAVYAGMSLEEQRKLTKQVEDSRGNKSGLILPPGRH